jgi:hypothetical protein
MLAFECRGLRDRLYVMKIDGTYHTSQLKACGTCREVDPEGVEACLRTCLSNLDLTLVLVVGYYEKVFHLPLSHFLLLFSSAQELINPFEFKNLLMTL